MPTYFAVFDAQSSGVGTENDFRGITKGTVKVQGGPVYTARFVKIEAENIAAGQEGLRQLYPSMSTGTPVFVTEAQWKES